jgi:hypothetical protein
LEEIEKLIERYNSTKAIRNDRIEFGVNFENFAGNYFSKLAFNNLEKVVKKRFLEKSRNITGLCMHLLWMLHLCQASRE